MTAALRFLCRLGWHPWRKHIFIRMPGHVFRNGSNGYRCKCCGVEFEKAIV